MKEFRQHQKCEDESDNVLEKYMYTFTYLEENAEYFFDYESQEMSVSEDNRNQRETDSVLILTTN